MLDGTAESATGPASVVWGPLRIVCDHDEWYRRTIRWQQGTEETSVHRALRDLFGAGCAGHPQFGRDAQHRLVAYDAGTRVCGGPQFAVDWPHFPSPDGIPDGTYFVSGKNGGGDRPAYLELPDGTLDLLPRTRVRWVSGTSATQEVDQVA